MPSFPSPTGREEPNSDAIAQIRMLISGIKIVIVTTFDMSGTPHSRPMVAQETAFDGTLWFVTSDKTHKVEEVSTLPYVHLNYVDQHTQRFISISGPAEIVRDQKKLRELWHLGYGTWFPQGIHDPSIVLIKVSVEDAEYWEAPGNVVQVPGFSSSSLKETSLAQETEHEHRELGWLKKGIHDSW